MTPDTLRLYRDHAGKWRWRYVAANGRVLADSGQGYVRRADAAYGARVVTGRAFRWVWSS